MQGTSVDWALHADTSTNASRNFKQGTYWPRGRMLGGCGSMGPMIYARGNARDYNRWHEDWRWTTVLPYFKRAETMLKFDRFRNEAVLRDMFLAAAKEQGLPAAGDGFNANTYIGFGLAQLQLAEAQRHSVAKAYLGPAKERPNLHVVKHAHVTRLDIDDAGSLQAVRFVYNQTKEFVVHATKEVVLSAGALSTPQILMLSGIGPEAALEKLAIPVRADLPVGENLQDHAITQLVYRFRKSSARATTRDDLFTNYKTYMFDRTGPMAANGISDLIGFVNTADADAAFPDVQYHFYMFPRQAPEIRYFVGTMGYTPEVARNIVRANVDADLVIVSVSLLNPESTGRVSLRSADFGDKVRIEPNYLDSDKDLETLVRGVRFMRKFEETAAFKANEAELVGLELPECAAADATDTDSDEYWTCYVRQLTTTMGYGVGTAQMGAVVDTELNVVGVTGLRVADASVMPRIVSADPNAATIMIGERASDFIAAKWMSERPQSATQPKHAEL